MKILYIDQCSGVSGDMINAALFGIHQDKKFIEDVIASLKVPGLKVDLKQVSISSISSWKFEVSCKEDGPYHRNLVDINRIIDESGLNEKTRILAKKIFDRLAEAEATVHNSTKEQIHFHEVGAWDSIADIVCAAASVVKIAPERIMASPFLLESGGTVMTMHGQLACPVPAVLELVKGLPSRMADIRTEITTPTGAAIVSAIADEFGDIPGIVKMTKIGYGAGTKQLQLPNFIRIMEMENDSIKNGKTLVLETNIDDMNPQLLPGVVEGLLNLGCLDAYWTVIQMKKGRTGFLLTALFMEEHLKDVHDYILMNTTSIGVRYYEVNRVSLKREIVTSETELGSVRFKVVTLPDGSRRNQPEYEDIKKIAKEKGLPEIEVARIIGELKG